uniref:Transcriptional activator protein n=1 Tax=Tomato leaf curl Sudan virus TaxID=270146 RepID=X5JA64_9GEMI|nr:trap [Tomato leaf curl Sudan virus]UCC70396.1 AC2 [Chilli leaf curl virus]ALN12535.1 trap [Tomato leaf curl Sudan virus]ALN12541.1 trap [Tomato leaf curl Sudan virus]ALN12547.1 trap [Tomato leaf curl Sudan virus]
MQPSSPSTSHCSQVPIKVQHKLAKKKIIRRRRVDLDCGCSYYLHINCSNHGFTHRGTHHCSSSREWRIYLGDKQSPLFQDHQPRREAIQQEPRYHFNTNPIQSQHKEGTGDSQMFSQLPNLDNLTASDWSFLKSI